ncbi:FAD/NAD-P-binding domain-containing protein [Epithele typhae]|uniref:FAD/NAD-P-binding domain-containing protein n=1 Tax=Epithele typhae TaxID=378194 RepID=UPI002008E9F5|nr:FAD/NAD-P-binding domain-containing protein [Epithele typhae]KAH9920248.1 FAD/NAD-P-binding domain-containing protein [Epithele typhae]
MNLFEAAPAFSEIGAGIGCGPNAISVLKKLGILEHLMKLIDPSELRDRGFRFYDGFSESVEPILAYPTVPEEKDQGLALHSRLPRRIIGALDASSAHFNKRATAVTESPTNPKRLVIHFQDGTTHEADVVLGADGIKSTVRPYVLGHKDDRVKFANTKLKAAGFKYDISEYPASVSGNSKHFILFAIKNASIINVVAFDARYDIEIGDQSLPEGAPWVESVTKNEMKAAYKGMNSSIMALLECMPETPSKWSVHVLAPPLESYAKGRVALLGDAAHAMLPHWGAGAGQGLEDAYLLVRLLSDPETDVDNVEEVLQEYSRIRQPRAQMVWEGSRRSGRIYDLSHPDGNTYDDVRNNLKDMYAPVWYHNMDDDVDEVVNELRKKGVFKAMTS